MSRKLRSPKQPWYVQLVLGLFETAASLKLAVLLIFSFAIVLGMATFVESRYGTPAVQFGIYGTWWFEWMNVFLAINIFCAAAIRYPWKRHQTGFVITHIGLLILLFGCYLSRRGGIDAQIPILEGTANNTFYEDALYLNVEVGKLESVDSSPDPKFVAKESFEVPFEGGVFNWADYPKLHWYESFFYLSPRSQGLLSDPAGKLAAHEIKLEALDFHANSERISVPSVRFLMRMVAKDESKLPPQMMVSVNEWQPLDLTVSPQNDSPFGLGDRVKQGGGSFLFWLVGSDDEVKTFLTKPDVDKVKLGERGQLVLYSQGQAMHISVDEKVGQGRFPLGATGLEAEVVQFFPNPGFAPGSTATHFRLVDNPAGDDPEQDSGIGPGVEARIYSPDGKTQTISLLADHPEVGRGDPSLGVYASYWFDHGTKSGAELLQGKGSARFDVIQGPDRKLYYRRWNRQEVIAADKFPLDGDVVEAFEMPIMKVQLALDERRYFPSPFATRIRIPALVATDFRRDFKFEDKPIVKAARLRFSTKGKTEEFWVLANGRTDDMSWQIAHADDDSPAAKKIQLSGEQEKVIDLGDKAIRITLPHRRTVIGYDIALNKFEKKLDPGSNQASHYGSMIDFVSPEGKVLPGFRDVHIEMNAPIDFGDPLSGRSYRLFQEGFHPIGDPESPRFFSFLTVNYDPGRGAKYLGSLLVVAGVAVMFYMRAYFFKTNTTKKPSAAASPALAQATR